MDGPHSPWWDWMTSTPQAARRGDLQGRGGISGPQQLALEEHPQEPYAEPWPEVARAHGRGAPGLPWPLPVDYSKY